MTMMSMPGAVRPVTVQPAVQRRTGLIRASIGSDHLITIHPRDASGKPAGPPRELYARVRDRAYHPHARGEFVCLSAQCAGKSWKTEAAMQADHPDALTMAKRGEVHVYAVWSNDLVNPDDKTSGALGLLSSAGSEA